MTAPRKPPRKLRVDAVMVEQGLAPNSARAAALVMAGEVLLGDQRLDKPGALVPRDASLRLRSDGDHGYVSRGALKLVRGLQAFDLAAEVAGGTFLDVGASTGGFTEVLLRHGAAKVYAIDVGYGQLAWSLRQDPRVVALDRHHIRDVAPTQVPGSHAAVIDTSFISLTAVLPAVAALLRGAGTSRPAWIIALIKPQFEVARDALVGGVVVEEAARRGAIDKIYALCTRHGWHASEAVPSPITGPAGNVEYLIHIIVAP